jgi:phenylpropionate dioxygenase-like ring-hydroxylating dioxygenase large terminal subunit
MDGKGVAELGTASPEIASLIARQPAGRSLTQAFYADPAVFRRDVDRVLMRHWLCAGHQSSIPKVGDFLLVEIASESAIIVRGEDGELRALVNVCRHRGSRICAGQSGHAASFTCPYHGWTYGLDGSLVAARHMPAEFDRSTHGLKRIQLRVLEGLIFISFAETPLALNRVGDTVRACYEPHGWATARVAHRETYRIDANWKLAVENYLECYHCGPAHPEYSQLHALEQPLARVEKLFVSMNKRTAALGIDIPKNEHWATSDSGEEAVRGFRYPLYDGVSSAGADGKPLAPLMGRFKDYDGGATSLHLGPTSFFVAYADHGVIYRFIPKAAQSCEMEVIWLVRGDAREGVDYDLEKLTWLWRVTSVADKRIIEQNQLGVNSRYYEPGPYAPMEYNTRSYVDWYLREIA